MLICRCEISIALLELDFGFYVPSCNFSVTVFSVCCCYCSSFSPIFFPLAHCHTFKFSRYFFFLSLFSVVCCSAIFRALFSSSSSFLRLSLCVYSGAYILFEIYFSLLQVNVCALRMYASHSKTSLILYFSELGKKHQISIL